MAPRSVSVENMMTGSFRSILRISLIASRPSMTGISMSRVTTSGLSWTILSSAILPLGAVPTTSMAGSDASTSVTIRRTTTESSTVSTRMRGPTSHLTFLPPALGAVEHHPGAGGSLFIGAWPATLNPDPDRCPTDVTVGMFVVTIRTRPLWRGPPGASSGPASSRPCRALAGTAQPRPG